ncbi:MAG: ABC transporter permease [Planctomycetota bacterium]|nr:ABC transporter permease [Planctomycetota bacterium]MDA1249016.1 ABC transporter permease [Planctomycetota bacterium]
MKLRAVLRDSIPPLVLAVAIIVTWHVLVRWFDTPSFLVPSPVEVANVAWEHFEKLARATGVTALAALSGFTASLVAGTAIAFAFSQSRIIRLSGYPYAIFLQTVPIVAIAPLIINWFGNGFQSVVIVAFIISLFPIITNATSGMLSVDPDLLDLFRLHKASRWQLWTKLRLPASVPHIITGARTSSGLAVIGAIVGEFFAGYGRDQFGLGYLIMMTSNQMKTAQLFAAVIASTLLGLVIFGAMGVLSSTVLSRWYDHE